MLSWNLTFAPFAQQLPFLLASWGELFQPVNLATELGRAEDRHVVTVTGLRQPMLRILQKFFKVKRGYRKNLYSFKDPVGH